MSTSAPSRSKSGDPRRRFVPWLVSGAIHTAVLAWWASLPEPPRGDLSEQPDLRPIELITVPSALEPPRPLPPAEPPRPEPEESEPEEPGSVIEPLDPRRVRRPSEPQVSAPSEPSEPSEPPEGPRSGAVALLGLRTEGRPARPSGPVTRPQLPPPVGGGQMVRKVGAGADGPAVSTRRDGTPRSLGEAGFRRRRSGKMVYRDAQTGFVATLRPDGRVKFRTTATPKSMPGLAEALRVASGQELFQKEKKRLLEETFELRLRMAIDFASDKIDRRLRTLYRELLEQWSDGSKSEARRRVALFERWDECEELPISLPGFEGARSSEIDDKRRDAGKKARETIERFIRRQLPEGSRQAYTEQELRSLNARRRSRERFAPY